MKRTTAIILMLVGALLFALIIVRANLAQGPQIQLQNPQVQAQSPKLPAENAISKMQLDDSVVTAAAIPLPDLTIKDMCLQRDRKTGWNYLRVTLGNIGVADAAAFELGLVFISPGGNEKLMTDKLDGLKAGESQSRDYAPLCCGWSPTNFLVDTSASFRAIADPKYYKTTPGYPVGMEIKPVIHESNEKNNEMMLAKSAVKPCTLAIQRIDRPNPAIRPPR